LSILEFYQKFAFDLSKLIGDNREETNYQFYLNFILHLIFLN